MACGRFVGTSDLLNQGDALVHEIGESGDTCYITEDGKAKAVLLDINRYNALMDLIEDSELPANEMRSEFRDDVRFLRSTTQILRKKNSA